MPIAPPSPQTITPQQAAVAVASLLCPKAKANYTTALAACQALLDEAEITTSDRLAHLLAQVFHETGALTILVENLNYSAKRIREVWPSRPEAMVFAGKPEALGNSVYANRMGNGGPETGDGYRYRGRGALQTTGEDAYRRSGRRMGVDLVADPDKLLEPPYVLRPALYEWQDSGCNALADAGDLKAITKKINGGYISLNDRTAWHRKVAVAMAKLPGVVKPKPAPASPAEQAQTTVATGGGLILSTATAAAQTGFSWPWIVAGVAAAVLVVCAGAYALHRRGK